MLLTISTTHRPATDLGFLLMKHPDNLHLLELPFGRATVFYPEASELRCTAALTLEVDTVELVRGRGGAAGLQDQYVNDRPYAASSLLAVAIGRALSTAMAGRSKLRQSLADALLPLEVTLTPLPARGGADIVAKLFEPLGYGVTTAAIPLDPAQPQWGDSLYVSLRLTGQVRLADLLTHLVVLIPVLDDAKHYYIGEDEVEKLLRRGDGWLETHPHRDLVISRYLLGLKSLLRLAHTGLDEGRAAKQPERGNAHELEGTTSQGPVRLSDLRMARVVAWLKRLKVTSVADLGCGEGRLLSELLQQSELNRIIGVEVAPRVLARAAQRLRLDEIPELKRRRIELLHGSLTYRDDRLQDLDAACAVEVIEHIDEERLPAFEQAIFGHARSKAVLVTTPNRDYNPLFIALPSGQMRHPDHRFEWSRESFEQWATQVAQKYGYQVSFEGIGAEDTVCGAPTQMGIFIR